MIQQAAEIVEPDCTLLVQFDLACYTAASPPLAIPIREMTLDHISVIFDRRSFRVMPEAKPI
jgi:hypothetical protein